MRTFEVATAQMHRQGHALWFLGDHFVHKGRIAMWQFIWVIPTLQCGLAHFVIAQIG